MAEGGLQLMGAYMGRGFPHPALQMYSLPMLAWLKWGGTAAGLAGALVIALNLPFSGWGFALFFVSSTTWLAAAALQRETALAVLSAGYTAVNVLGIYRWLIV